MVCLPNVKMPNNCHECDACGISDVVGLKCPCEENYELYDYEKRPKECPVNENTQAHENTRMNDPVNHPAHYTSGKIEVIDFLEDQKFPFHLANAVKYISRAGKKDPEKTVQDLEKAIWYINRYIGLLQKAQDEE